MAIISIISIVSPPSGAPLAGRATPRMNQPYVTIETTSRPGNIV